MNKDQQLLQEAYGKIYQSSSAEPLYIGEPYWKQSFMDWLKFRKYEVRQGGSLNTNSVLFNKLNLLKIPFAFNEVNGYFMCSMNKLISLKGSPQIVNGDFYCDSNKLASLEGAPKIVRGTFSCTLNPLQSLEGAPEVIEGEFQSDQFSDADYRTFMKKRKYLEGNLNKDLDIDLEDFS